MKPAKQAASRRAFFAPAVLFLCSLLFLLCACSRQGEENRAVLSASAPRTFAAASDAGEGAPSGLGPTDEQIDRAYEEAAEAYGWFDLTTLPLEEGAPVLFDGQYYQKVRHDTIRTKEDLKAYLQTLFADDIVAGLLDETDGPQRYRDIGGELYAIPADRGADITKGKETRRILRKNDGEAVVEVAVEVLDPKTRKVVGRETHRFSYASDGGKWVFRSFGPVR